MKKLLLLTAIIFSAGLNGSIAQNVRINPIPSFNFYMQDNAAFQEPKSTFTSSKEKRDMNVVVSGANHGCFQVFATVWVVKDFGSVILGPFFVDDSRQLSIGIGDGQWGTIIKSETDVFVSVWIDE